MFALPHLTPPPAPKPKQNPKKSNKYKQLENTLGLVFQ